MIKKLFLCLTVISFNFAQEIVKDTTLLMGSRFDFTVVSDSKSEGQKFISMAIDEISRIEKLISSWDIHSQTSQINRMAGIEPVIVDKELFYLIQRSKKISELTNGLYDISYASLDQIWKFDGSITILPSEDVLKKSISKINYEDIMLDDKNYSVFLKNEGMKIGFGSIGKGYAADKAKELLIQNGVQSGIINASGDIAAWGYQPNGEEWLIAIKNPFNKNKIFSWLPIENKSIVTSGDYEKFIMIEGERFSHIINPKTGYPVKGLTSVSIIAPTAEIGDALATAVFILGKNDGLKLINSLPEIECLIVDSDGEFYPSDNLAFKKDSNNYKNLKKSLSKTLTRVKEYEKVYINDPDMDLNPRKVNKFETNFQVYRESASGANGGKSGGGCGCN